MFKLFSWLFTFLIPFFLRLLVQRLPMLLRVSVWVRFYLLDLILQ